METKNNAINRLVGDLFSGRVATTATGALRYVAYSLDDASVVASAQNESELFELLDSMSVKTCDVLIEEFPTTLETVGREPDDN